MGIRVPVVINMEVWVHLQSVTVYVRAAVSQASVEASQPPVCSKQMKVSVYLT